MVTMLYAKKSTVLAFQTIVILLVWRSLFSNKLSPVSQKRTELYEQKIITTPFDKEIIVYV